MGDAIMILMNLILTLNYTNKQDVVVGLEPMPSCADSNKNGLDIDNGVLHLKLDLTSGGAIYYISESGKTRNMVNIHADFDTYC